jgi:hypothetical protein
MDITVDSLTRTPFRLFIFEIVCLGIIFVIYSLIWTLIFLLGLKPLDAGYGIENGDMISYLMYFTNVLVNFFFLVWVGKKIEGFKKQSKKRSSVLFAYSGFNFLLVFLFGGGLIMLILYWIMVYKDYPLFQKK